MSLLTNKELEERLSAAGKSLLQPSTSLDELRTLLDQIEELLSRVGQSPAKSMQTALSPLMKALVSEELLKHSDVDVQVGVAACISEITRITAPEAPYDDEKMKGVFQLIVSSFDNLSDISSRSHQKRATILETVAKVRSCVIMLDLELDQMIIEMFQHFLKSIRTYHGEVIFASMETIMTLVLEESEDISPDLLNPILDTLRKNNEKEVLPIAKKLAKRVIQNGADKLRPYLTTAVNTSNVSLDDYNEVIASVCQKNSASSGHIDENISKDELPANDVKEEIKPGDKDPAEEVGEEMKPLERDSALKGSPPSVACNSINETRDEETMTDEIFLKKSEFKQQLDAKSTSKTESDEMASQKPAQLEVKEDCVANGEAQEFNSSNNSAESSDFIDDEKQAEQVPCHQDIPREEIHNLPGESPPVEADKPLDTVKDTNIQLSPPKEAEVDAVNVASTASPNQSGSLPDENQLKRSGRTKRKENMVKEDTASAGTVSKKASEGLNIAEVTKKRRTMKKQHDDLINKDGALTEGVSKTDAGTMIDSEARDLDSEKLGIASNKIEDGPLPKEDRRRGGRGKPTSQKDKSKYSSTEDNRKDTVASSLSPVKLTKEEVSQDETPRVSAKRKRTPGTDNVDETPRTSAKRKRTPGTDNTSQTIQYGENLVGSKVKVWWPKDQTFYEGMIDSFDSVKKKHKVVYNDGDTETLNLRRERWEFVGDDSVLDEGQYVEHSSHDASSNKKRKKGNAKPETSNKHEKMEDPPKRKLKGKTTKSGSKAKDDGKAVAESTENSEDETDKSDDHSEELNGKSPDGSAAKAKSRDVGVAKTSSHKKRDVRHTTNSKGKTPQSGKTPSPSGKGMKKSGSAKAKEIVRAERTMNSEKSPETPKGGKSRGSATKSGKKRRR